MFASIETALLTAQLSSVGSPCANAAGGQIPLPARPAGQTPPNSCLPGSFLLVTVSSLAHKGLLFGVFPLAMDGQPTQPVAFRRSTAEPVPGRWSQFRLVGTGGLRQWDGVPACPWAAPTSHQDPAGCCWGDPFPFLPCPAEPSLTPAANPVGCWPHVPGFGHAAGESPRCRLAGEQSRAQAGVPLPGGVRCSGAVQTAPWGLVSCQPFPGQPRPQPCVQRICPGNSNARTAFGVQHLPWLVLSGQWKNTLSVPFPQQRKENRDDSVCSGSCGAGGKGGHGHGETGKTSIPRCRRRRGRAGRRRPFCGGQLQVLQGEPSPPLWVLNNDLPAVLPGRASPGDGRGQFVEGGWTKCAPPIHGTGELCRCTSCCAGCEWFSPGSPLPAAPPGTPLFILVDG